MELVQITEKAQIEFAGNMIYQTDSYIYPALFSNKSNAQRVFKELMNLENDMFAKRNMLVGYENGQNVGLICFYENDFVSVYEDWIKAFDKCEIARPPSFEHAYFGYIQKLAKENYEGIYITNVCIDERYRNRGYGNKMLGEFCRKFKTKILFLDVLKNNPAAIRLYTKYGFQIVKECEGFSITKDKPRCYQMRKLPV